MTGELTVIARFRGDFPGKFGLPRQSGLAPDLQGVIGFEPGFRDPNLLRGLEEFSHLWLIWQFSENLQAGYSPTVRPPRLGGNRRRGLLATRSPFRPNALGLSAVSLERVEWQSPCGPLLHVSGADLLDGTPIFDIKPYVPVSDCIPQAGGGFSDQARDYRLQVVCPPELLQALAPEKRPGLLQALALDPRPAYQPDGERVYGFAYAGHEISFRVAGGSLTVLGIVAKNHV